MVVLVVGGIALAVVGLLLQLVDFRLVKPESGSAGRRITSRLFAVGVVCQVAGVALIVVGGVNG
jgi:uncharacterized membrane protein YjfL (UPF0719 family)